MEKNLKKVLLLATIIYLGIAPFTSHPDTKLTLYYGSFINQKVLNIYDHLAETHDQYPPFHYPPLNYFLLATEYKVIKPLAGEEFLGWLESGSAQAPNHNYAWRFNFLSKLPLMLTLLISGLILYRIVRERLGQKPKMALVATTFWLLNPISLYSVVMMGQHDIFPLAFLLASILILVKKPKLSLFLAGIGGAIKTFPLLWLPFLALASANSWQKRAKNFIIGLLPYCLTTLPFWNSPEFIKQCVFSGLAQRIFAAQIPVGFGDAILLVPVLLGILLLQAIQKSARGKSFGVPTLTFYLGATSLIIIGFSHVHPQWYLWPLPFLSVLLAYQGEQKQSPMMIKTVILLTLISFLGNTLLINDKFLTWGLLLPLNPEILNLPSITDFLALKAIDVNFIKNLFVTSGVIAAAYFTLATYQTNEKKN